MRLRLLSDLHLEFAPLDLSPAGEDLLVLAGDIGVGISGLAWARRCFTQAPIIYVPGNHEYYHADWHGMNERLRSAAAALGITLLDADEVTIGDVRFLGCTLWTDFDFFGAERRAASMYASLSLNDYRYITQAGADLRPEHTRERHFQERAWLSQALTRDPAPVARKTVVITHMLPSAQSVSPRFAQMPLTAGFASHLDGLFDHADLWLHGHTHDSFDYREGRCRVVCNPRGYRMRTGNTENAEFNPGLIIEV